MYVLFAASIGFPIGVFVLIAGTTGEGGDRQEGDKEPGVVHDRAKLPNFRYYGVGKGMKCRW